MQVKKNKQRLFLLVTLVGVTLAAYFLTQGAEHSAIDKNVFRIDELESVDKIILERGTTRTELAFNGARWMVNGNYPADRNLITVLFATLRQAEPKRNIATSMKDSVANLMQGATKVTLLSKDREARKFMAGGNANKTQSFFTDPSTNETYVMAIPGYRVYVSGIFELDENGWRDKYLLGDYNWRNFKSLSMRYTEKPAESFNVGLNSEKFFVVQGIESDTAKLNTFLNDLSLITVDRYLPGRVADSLREAKPFVTIMLKDIIDKETTLKLFRDDKNLIPAVLNNDQAVFFSTRQVAAILKPKSFFKKKR